MSHDFSLDRTRLMALLEYPGLKKRKWARETVKIWIMPGLSPWVCWGLIEDEGDYFVRRVILVQPDHPLKIESETFASEVQIAASTSVELLTELSKIELNPFYQPEVIGTDGVYYGVEFKRFNTQVELGWWCDCPPTWKPLEAWHLKTTKKFQSILPGTVENIGL